MTAPRTVRAVGGFVLLAFALVAVRVLGDGSLAGPPTSSTDAFGAWVDDRGPVTVAMSLLRLATEGVLWYLLVVAIIVVVARATRSVVALRFADVVSAPLPDRLVRVALGISLATAGQPTSLPGGHLAAEPTVTGGATMVALSGDDANGAAPTMERLSGDPERRESATAGPVAADGADGDTARATPWPDDARSTPAAPAPVDLDRSTWTVTDGESFWVIADEVVSEQLGRPATDAEIAPFWDALVAANRHRLVDPDDPDLVLPGQVMELPTRQSA